MSVTFCLLMSPYSFQAHVQTLYVSKQSLPELIFAWLSSPEAIDYKSANKIQLKYVSVCGLSIFS